jgi:hypothetical protein
VINTGEKEIETTWGIVFLHNDERVKVIEEENGDVYEYVDTDGDGEWDTLTKYRSAAEWRAKSKMLE